MEHILTILLFLPAVAAIFAAFVSKEQIRNYAVAVTLLEFVLSLALPLGFNSSSAAMQFVEIYPLVANYGINYYVGIDGFSIYLVLLSTFITLVALVSMEDVKNIKNMVITLLFMEMTMIGVFVAIDAVVFYIFFEVSLVPMLYLIGAWGAGRRIYAAVKFFLYTFTGSLIMLLGLLYLAYAYHTASGVWSFSILDWHMLVLPYNMQIWVFLALFAGFAVKVPMFPFHTWLPYAHGQAPTIGSVLLAAVLLKMGTYGFIRFSLPILPDASMLMITPVAIICIIMVIYAAFIAFAQEDIKQVIAYSSISHMGVIVLGTFAMNAEGIAGSVFLMISHGLVSGALFMLVGVIYERMHTKQMSEFGGIAVSMPRYATIFGIVLMGSVGLPLTVGFVGEFLCLLGFYKVSPLITALAGTTIILGAIYMLNLFRRSFFGDADKEKIKMLVDLNKRELFGLVPIAILVIVLGVYPKPILKPAEVSAQSMLQLMFKKALFVEHKFELAKYNTPKGGR